MPSLVQATKRALVTLLLALARQYEVMLSVNRDSTDRDVEKAVRKMMRHVHPDKGGRPEDCVELNDKRDAWNNAKEASGAGRPATGNRRAPGPGQAGRPGSAHPVPEATGIMEAHGSCEFCNEESKQFRVQAKAVLLTYNGVRDMAGWEAFKEAAGARFKAWRVLYFGATLERCRKDKLH
eukprot:5737303-Karenia_brevis.AAC.2